MRVSFSDIYNLTCRNVNARNFSKQKLCNVITRTCGFTFSVLSQLTAILKRHPNAKNENKSFFSKLLEVIFFALH